MLFYGASSEKAVEIRPICSLQSDFAISKKLFMSPMLAKYSTNRQNILTKLTKLRLQTAEMKIFRNLNENGYIEIYKIQGHSPIERQTVSKKASPNPPR